MRNKRILRLDRIKTLALVAVYLCAHATGTAGATVRDDGQHSSHAGHPSESTQKATTKVKQQAEPKPGTPEEVVYSCPMHPRVTSKKAGACPKCAMALVAKASGETGDDVAGGSSNHSTGRMVPERWEISTAKMERIAAYDRHGQRLNFYLDLIKAKTVAINFVASPCAGACESMNSFREAQRRLGERLGASVKLITVYLSETPADVSKLQKMAADYEVGAAWSLVAINKSEVEQLLRAFGKPDLLHADTSSPLIVGNEASGYWTQLDDAAPAVQLIKAIENALTKNPEASATTPCCGIGLITFN